MFFQFALTITPVMAAEDEDEGDTSFGGILISPIMSLIVGIGDRHK